VLTLKFGKSQHRLGRPVIPGPKGGLTGVHSSQSGTKMPGGQTAPRGGLTGSLQFRVELGVWLNFEL
jgi:hypothetical protein